MNIRDIQLPDKHWLVLGASFLISGLSVWTLLSPEELLTEEANIAVPTKLRLAPIGSAIALLEQPVFNRERSPIAPANDANALAFPPSGDAAAAPAAPPPQLPTLVGVATGRDKAVAILKGADGAARNVSAGDSVDGWTIISISRNGAKLSAAGVTQDITLNYGNQQSASTAPAVAIAVPSERGN
jgi:hypothetical protein